MESVIVVGIHHILCAGDDDLLAMAEPADVQNQYVIPVHHQPQAVAGQEARNKAVCTVCEVYKHTQYDAKHNDGRPFPLQCLLRAGGLAVVVPD